MKENLDLSRQLLQIIGSQDALKLCQFIQSAWLPASVQRWLFYRWEKSVEEYHQIFPEPGESNRGLPGDCQRLLESRGPLVHNDISKLGRQWPECQAYPVALLLPLIHDSEPVGAIQGFTDLDTDSAQSILKQLGPLCGIFAESFYLLSLLNEKDERALTDSLTGLYNAQFLTQALEDELKRCKRYGNSLSVIFIDIDFFKNVNDAHGHLFGSSTLNEMASVLRSVVRESDLLSRFGGDEYVVVTRNLGLEGACAVADRIRQKISDHRFGSDKGKTIQLTVSAGVATYPENGKTAMDLIHHADQAMYKAKQDHGNCVRSVV